MDFAHNKQCDVCAFKWYVLGNSEMMQSKAEKLILGVVRNKELERMMELNFKVTN